MKSSDFGVLLRAVTENKHGGEIVAKAWSLVVITMKAFRRGQSFVGSPRI